MTTTDPSATTPKAPDWINVEVLASAEEREEITKLADEFRTYVYEVEESVVRARQLLTKVWGTVRVTARDLADTARQVRELAEAVAMFVESGYSDNVEVESEKADELRDVEMLGRMLDHLDTWGGFLIINRANLREQLDELEAMLLT